MLCAFVSPLLPAEDIANWAHIITNGKRTEANVIERMEDLTLWGNKQCDAEEDENFMEVALDFQREASEQCNASFEENTLFNFVRTKVGLLAQYHSDIEFDSLFRLCESSGEFMRWYEGLILPYINYYKNYGSLLAKDVPASEFLTLSTEEQFEYLILPLDSSGAIFGDKLSIKKYFPAVILPFLKHRAQDLNPLLIWILKRNENKEWERQFELWLWCLEAVANFNLDESMYRELVRVYVAFCFFFGTQTTEKPLLYNQIHDSLSLFESYGSVSNVPEGIFQGSFEAFLTGENVFSPLLVDFDSSLATMKAIVKATCAMSVSGLSIAACLRLKSNATTLETKLSELSGLLRNVSESNKSVVLGSAQTFKEEFCATQSEKDACDEIVLEMLLGANLVNDATRYFEASQLSLETYSELLSKRFWVLVENASNLDDRIGKMQSASQCLDALRATCKNQEVARATHLLKGLRNLKNFKLVLVKHQPVTPKQVLDKLNASGDELQPVALVATILEQNPKSYLAHEKLQKVASDFALFLNIEEMDLIQPKVKSACIESALVDGNFDFAYKQCKLLIEYYALRPETLNDYWLTFYQVGKFVSPNWFSNEDSTNHIATLLKQRELLALALKMTVPVPSRANNSRIILTQLKSLNRSIEEWHRHKKPVTKPKVEPVVEVAPPPTMRSTKVSNLLASGIGWAIGAHKD